VRRTYYLPPCYYFNNLSELGGQLEEALVQYKRSKQFGVDRAAMHIRNVSSVLYFC
jgi:hypothetical protein